MHLDALRGAAALVVFLNHTRALYFGSVIPAQEVNSQIDQSTTSAHVSFAGGLFPGKISFGGEAVIIFFVLSGYLVGGGVIRSVRADRWSWPTYLTKRLTRLYVVLLPALVLCKFLDTLGMHLAHAGSVYFTPKNIALITTSGLEERLRGVVMLGNALFLQGIVVDTFGTDVALWSLANEFWYYVIFPFFILVLFRKGHAVSRVLLCLVGFGLLAAVGLKIEVLFAVWILGALLDFVPKKLSQQAAKTGVFVTLAGLIAVMVSVRIFTVDTLVADYLIALMTFAALYCMVQNREPAKAGVYKAASAYFSKISYSLYLFHLPIAVFLCSLINRPWRVWLWTPPNIVKYAATDLVILAIVTALWKIFESNTDRVRQTIFRMES